MSLVMGEIECAIYGWQDKPLLMAKCPHPLDEAPPVFEVDESRVPGAKNSIRNAILACLRHLGPNGQWVMREAIGSRATLTNERQFTEALGKLVADGHIERSHARGARVAYRLAIGPRPELDKMPHHATRLMAALSQEWVSTNSYAERLGIDPTAVTYAVRALVKRGLIDVQRQTRLSGETAKSTSDGAGYEYRASSKLLVERMRKRAG